MNNSNGAALRQPQHIATLIMHGAFVDYVDERMRARGRLEEVEPGRFVVIPVFRMDREGSPIPWNWPQPGSPIPTLYLVTNAEEGEQAVVDWAKLA